MVFRRGKVGQHVAELVEDMRQVMSPYTAKNLKEVRRLQRSDTSVRIACYMMIEPYA